MLTETRREDIPDARGARGMSEDAAFADATVREFAESGMECAEVTDWPGKDFSVYRDVTRAAAILRNRAKRDGLKVMQRKGRLFLQRGE